MEERIKRYRRYMDELLGELTEKVQDGIITDDEVTKIKAEHLTQISFFQHERLIHLIVTVTFAVLEVIALLMALLVPQIATLVLAPVILILLVPYIRHYYILENEVQKMYFQYDKLCGLEKSGGNKYKLFE